MPIKTRQTAEPGDSKGSRQLTSRASPESWKGGGQGIEHGLGMQAGGQGFVLWSKGGQLISPAIGQHSIDEGLELLTLLLVLAAVLLQGLHTSTSIVVSKSHMQQVQGGNTCNSTFDATAVYE